MPLFSRSSTETQKLTETVNSLPSRWPAGRPSSASSTRRSRTARCASSTASTPTP